MPISRAASGSCAVARIALPRRVFATNVVSSITSGIVATTASTSPREMESPSGENSSCCAWMRSGTPRWEAPIQRMPTFCRMNDMPTAVISGASFGAPRSGR